MKTRIYQPHTHADKHYNPGPEGVEVDLPPHAIEWLKANNPGVLERPAPVMPAAPQPIVAATHHTEPKA